MAAGLIVIPSYMPAIDRNGDLVPGAKMYFYLDGTTVPTTVYLDSGLSVPAANPLSANSSGIFASTYAVTGTPITVAVTTADDVILGAPFTGVYPSEAVGLATEAAAVAVAAAAVSTAEAGISTAQAGIATTQAGIATAAATTATADAVATAADRVQTGLDAASAASSAAAAAVSAGAHYVVPFSQGLVRADVDAASGVAIGGSDIFGTDMVWDAVSKKLATTLFVTLVPFSGGLISAVVDHASGVAIGGYDVLGQQQAFFDGALGPVASGDVVDELTAAVGTVSYVAFSNGLLKATIDHDTQAAFQGVYITGETAILDPITKLLVPSPTETGSSFTVPDYSAAFNGMTGVAVFGSSTDDIVWEVIGSYDQSFGQGSVNASLYSTSNTITTSPFDDHCFMPPLGMVPAGRFTSKVLAFEQKYAPQNSVETMLSTCMKYIQAGFVAAGLPKRTMLAWLGGNGGTPLEQLAPGTTYWDNWINKLKDYKTLADLAGARLVCRIVFTSHGSDNRVAPVDHERNQRARILMSLRDTMQATIQAITNQTEEVVLACTSVSRVGSTEINTGIDIAAKSGKVVPQWQPNIGFIYPTGAFADHPTPKGYLVYGYGAAMTALGAVYGMQFRPVELSRMYAVGNNLYGEFLVPEGKSLGFYSGTDQFDISGLPTNSAGLYLWDNGGVAGAERAITFASAAITVTNRSTFDSRFGGTIKWTPTQTVDWQSAYYRCGMDDLTSIICTDTFTIPGVVDGSNNPINLVQVCKPFEGAVPFIKHV